MERRQRIGQSIAAGLSAAGSDATATGTATYSDGTTANYSVTMPNPQAQRDAVNRAQEAIGAAREKAGYVVASELKRNTLFPGQKIIGQLFFLRQKAGEDLLVKVNIGNVSYEFPYHLSKTGGAESRALAANVEHRPVQGKTTAELADQQISPGQSAQPPAASMNFAQVLEAYRKGAEQGDADAEFNLGLLYFRGHGVAQDYAQAAAWYRKAAEQGWADAEAALGAMYYLGQGVPQDYADAALWFRKAADRGTVRAEYMLGSLYESGRGVQQDYGEAYFWLNLAAAGSSKRDEERFAKARDQAAARLSLTVLSDEQKRAADWSAAHPLKR
jgi:hypothetical protein